MLFPKLFLLQRVNELDLVSGDHTFTSCSLFAIRYSLFATIAFLYANCNKLIVNCETIKIEKNADTYSANTSKLISTPTSLCKVINAL